MKALPWTVFDEQARTQFWASLALRHTHGMGPRSCARLLQTFGSAYAAMQCMERWGEAGISAAKKAQVQSGSWRTTARLEWDSAQSLDAHIILWHDAMYPPLLRQLPDAPVLLYCKGDLSLLRAPAVAVVGSRSCTPEGLRVSSNIARRLSACGITIVSGMALGIDSAAHTHALCEVGKSVAVLGTGIDVIYPPNNAQAYAVLAQEGLLVSEFAAGTMPMGRNFPVRNRIISGLSLGVLVVEAALRSGSLITARLALEQNREVYAIPGPVFSKQSEGCQDLIRQGAHVVFSAEDIMRDLAVSLENYGISGDALGPDYGASSDSWTAGESPPLPSPRPVPSPAVPVQGVKPRTARPLPEGDAGSLVAYVRQHGSTHVDTLCVALNLPVARVNSLLIELEIAKQLTRLSGAWYCECLEQ
ncbi:MAG: DNA-processing protein DprA [Desulfovibrionaceae bacterium]